MLRMDVITIFPGLFEPFRMESMMGIAQEKGLLDLRIHNLRDWATDRHRTVDDSPFGGGPGMVMKPEPLVTAIEEVAGEKAPGRQARVILLSPQGQPFHQKLAQQWSEEAHLVLVAGRYEGVDQRVVDLAVDEEVSLGDYVLCGGEIPAMAVMEAVTRLIPGVLGNPESLLTESFQAGLLEGPQYTRPVEFRGETVPEVLRSGDHAAVARWRKERSREKTVMQRPDLLVGSQGEDEK